MPAESKAFPIQQQISTCPAHRYIYNTSCMNPVHVVLDICKRQRTVSTKQRLENQNEVFL